MFSLELDGLWMTIVDRLKTSPVSLSIIIPNYNHAAFLPECLDSVLSQSSPPDAVCVVDDASTDNSIEVIRSYVERFPRLQLAQQSRNRGVFANINQFLPRVQGTHVFVLAADDFLLPGSVEMVRAMLSEHPQAGFCLTDTVEVFPDQSQRPLRYNLSPGPAFFSPAQAPAVIRGRPLIGQCFFHLGGLRQIGGFPESVRWHADHFVCAVLALRQGFCYLPSPGAAFRRQPASYSAQGMGGDRQCEVMLNFLDGLCRPELADVKAGLRDSQVLAIFDRGLLSALWRNPEHRYFLTSSLLARILYRRLRRVFRHPIPGPVKKWFRARFGRASAP